MRTVAEIRDLLEQVKDPEIPVISIRELGVLREVNLDGDAVEVIITPTYSGCPAMDVMQEDVEKALREAGIQCFSVKQVLSPAWSLKGGVPVTACPQCGSQDTMLVSQFGSTPCKALYKCNACLEPFDLFKCL